jgi:hypothetical protein
MSMINRNYNPEIATVIAESDTGEEKLCIDKRGQFFVCNAGGKILYEIERDAALEVADWWDADPELIVSYFGIEGA